MENLKVDRWALSLNLSAQRLPILEAKFFFFFLGGGALRVKISRGHSG